MGRETALYNTISQTATETMILPYRRWSRDRVDATVLAAPLKRLACALSLKAGLSICCQEYFDSSRVRYIHYRPDWGFSIWLVQL